MTGTTGRPKRIVGDRFFDHEPVPLTARHIDEELLQSYLDRYPELLPMAAIGEAWGPLVSLGREVPTAPGPIDNLFISPRGDITVV